MHSQVCRRATGRPYKMPRNHPCFLVTGLLLRPSVFRSGRVFAALSASSVVRDVQGKRFMKGFKLLCEI